MRYRINGPHPGVDAAGSGHMMLFTVLLSLLIGAILVGLGRRGRQRWVVFWGGTLVLAALIYLVAVWVGYG
ncbi:MAG: hypothetical protein M0Z84_09675 [Gammaproteobacteria bacterium]|nr:hypothetical protein [Gammaproteobacteria bacterium]